MLEEKIVTCPNCGSQRSYKDGIRYTDTKEIQRYLCRECGYRFS
jgi:transposase-like protein